MLSINRMRSGEAGMKPSQDRVRYISLTAAQIAADTTLRYYTASDFSIDVTVSSTYASQTHYLPPVREAAGQVISIRVHIANAQALTIAHQSDSLGWTNLTMDADGDFVVLMSDGVRWCVICNGIA